MDADEDWLMPGAALEAEVMLGLAVPATRFRLPGISCPLVAGDTRGSLSAADCLIPRGVRSGRAGEALVFLSFTGKRLLNCTSAAEFRRRIANRVAL